MKPWHVTRPPTWGRSTSPTTQGLQRDEKPAPAVHVACPMTEALAIDVVLLCSGGREAIYQVSNFFISAAPGSWTLPGSLTSTICPPWQGCPRVAPGECSTRRERKTFTAPSTY